MEDWKEKLPAAVTMAIQYLTEYGYTVTPPPEPKTVEVDFWVNVYPEGHGVSTFRRRELADMDTSSNRIACINIKRTVTEGEGLE